MMPLFFFNIDFAAGIYPDDLGLHFERPEAAYKEACQAIPELAAEFARMGDSTEGYAFQITDVAGRLLWRIAFSDILGNDERSQFDHQSLECRDETPATS